MLVLVGGANYSALFHKIESQMKIIQHKHGAAVFIICIFYFNFLKTPECLFLGLQGWQNANKASKLLLVKVL